MILKKLLVKLHLMISTTVCLLLSILIVIWGSYRSDVYPSRIEKYHIRLNQHSNKPVHSGLLHTLPEKLTLNGFRKHLQCTIREPNLNHNNGLVDRMRTKPLTTKHLKYLCAYVEEHCNERLWPQEKCKRPDFNKYFNGSYYRHDKGFNAYTPFSQARLLRVLSGQLYYDWPWGIERLKEDINSNPMVPMLQLALVRITDMNDSVFFTGGADPNIPWKVDFPMFSFCTGDDYAEMVFPWFDMFTVESERYRLLREKGLDFNESSYQRVEPGYRPWHERVPKAALFGKYQKNRHFILDAARLNADLFDIRILHVSCVWPWNPLSRETCKQFELPEGYKLPPEDKIREFQSLPAGYAAPLLNFSTLEPVTYQPGAYKYVIVPLGWNEFLSTSSRMSHILAYSGAVVLMPRSTMKFHFSAQLKPWVHYVPLSFSGADVAEKIRWLRDHDDLAQQIAENGRNFARSYLRLEDYYCYAAQVLQTMSELSRRTSVVKDVFFPQKVLPLYNPWYKDLA